MDGAYSGGVSPLDHLSKAESRALHASVWLAQTFVKLEVDCKMLNVFHRPVQLFGC